MYHVTTIGRVGIDLYASDFKTPLKDVRQFTKYVGGDAANIAAGLAMLGLRVAIVSCVSDDELGDFATEFSLGKISIREA
jgi:5-dehydro-2-deoxygluconokinase